MTDIKITLETLYDILRNEKKKEDLQKLEATFFLDVVQYLREKQTLLESKSKSTEVFAAGERDKLEYELRSIKRILKEIYEKREKKILDIALNKSRTGSDIIDTSSMLHEEREFYQKILKNLDVFRQGVLLSMTNAELPKIPDQKVLEVPEEKRDFGKVTPTTPSPNLPPPESSIKPLTPSSSPETPPDRSPPLTPNPSLTPPIPSPCPSSSINPPKPSPSPPPLEVAKEESTLKEPPRVIEEKKDDNETIEPTTPEEKEQSTPFTKFAEKDKPPMTNGHGTDSSSTTKIKFIRPLPRFVWKDMKEYGPYDVGEELEIYPEVAELIVRKGRAVKV